MEYQDPSDVLQSIIDRHPAVFAVLHEAVLLGWNAFKNDVAKLTNAPFPLRLRTRRNLANDYAVGFSRQLLEPMEQTNRLRWVDEAETTTLRLDPRYAIRLKKTDPSGRTSSIPTIRQQRIADSGQLLLFGISEDDLLTDGELWLTVGYVPDVLDEQINVVGLTVGDGRVGLQALDRADDLTLAHLAPECWPLIQEQRRLLG